MTKLGRYAVDCQLFPVGLRLTSGSYWGRRGTGIAPLDSMKKRILVVEDCGDLADLMNCILRYLGYEVLRAGNGVQAVESAISLNPDLITMDMLMPKMDGFDAVLQLRQHPKTKTVPILAVTALTSLAHREKCFASGCDDYIVKPFTNEALADAVKKLLQDCPGVTLPAP